MRVKPITEAEFTTQVIQYASLRGWRVAHFRAARTASGWRTPVQGHGAGFPDLVMVRGGVLIVAELKRSKREKPRPEQDAWLDAFRGVAVVKVWAPDDWSEIEALLA